ncbi:hypothetical protein D3C73_1374240 [compost metagenome]
MVQEMLSRTSPYPFASPSVFVSLGFLIPLYFLNNNKVAFVEMQRCCWLVISGFPISLKPITIINVTPEKIVLLYPVNELFEFLIIVIIPCI